MKQWTENKLKKTVSLFAGIVALVVTITLPIGYFYTEHQHLSLSLQNAADIIADDISVYTFQYPDSWSFQEARLMSFLEQHKPIHNEQILLISDEHDIHLSSGIPQTKPILIRHSPVKDGVNTVAMIEIQASLYPIIVNTALVLLPGSFLGLMIFASLYYWPLKALKQTLSELDEAHSELEVEIAAKEALLQRADDLTKRLHDMAMHDSLTGLANRTLYFDRLNHSLHIAERNDDKVAVVMIDLNKFKPINDELGHHIGDQLLINMSHRLQDTLRKSDTIARIGGDEFALVLHVKSTDDCERLCQKLFDLVKTPIHLGRHTLNIEASFGIAMYPDHASSPELLLQKADTAMYTAKNNHSHIAVYTTDN